MFDTKAEAIDWLRAFRKEGKTQIKTVNQFNQKAKKPVFSD